MYSNLLVRKLELLCRNIFNYVEIYGIIKVYTKSTILYKNKSKNCAMCSK